jgi:predicted metal-dependent phosphoesterase TrpH
MTSSLSKADLHIHTIHGDGVAGVPELLEYVAACTGLRLIAITDHDTIVGARQATRLARGCGITVVVGEEISTADGHL